MAKKAAKKTFYNNDKGSSVFSNSDKFTNIGNIPCGPASDYKDTITWIDSDIKKNSSYKKNKD